MARIAGVDLPKDKRIEIGLTYVYGIGRKSASDILKATGISPDIRVKDLTEQQEAQLRECIDKNYVVKLLSEMPSDHLIFCHSPFPPAFSLSQHQDLFQ